MSRYKEGSRIQIMWDLFEKKGPEACETKGPTLNLKDVTIKHWLRVWTREKNGGGPKPKELKQAKVKVPKPPKVDAEGKPVKKVPKRIAGYKFNPTGKKRVRCTYMPMRLGWLIEAGPEVSEVRWDDEYGEVAIINRDLREVTPKEEEAWRKKYKPVEEEK